MEPFSQEKSNRISTIYEKDNEEGSIQVSNKNSDTLEDMNLLASSVDVFKTAVDIQVSSENGHKMNHQLETDQDFVGKLEDFNPNLQNASEDKILPKKVESNYLKADTEEPESTGTQKSNENLIMYESMQAPNFKGLDIDNNRSLTDKSDELEKISPKVLERGLDVVMKNLPDSLVKQTKEKIEFALNELDQENAHNWINDGVEKNRLTMYSQNDKNWIIKKVEMNMNLSMDKCIEGIQDIEMRLKYDGMIKKIFELKDLNGYMKMIGSVIKGSWPVSDRLMCIYTVGFYTENEDYILIGFDTEKNEVKDKGAEAKMFCMTWLFSKVSENVTKVTYYVKTDPAIAGIPQGIIKRLTKDTVLLPLYFAEYRESGKK